MSERDREKDYGPVAIGGILGVCIASYIRNGVTREEFVNLAGETYDGILTKVEELGGAPALVPTAIKSQMDRLKRMVAHGQVPDTKDEALWFLLGQFEDAITKIRDEM